MKTIVIGMGDTGLHIASILVKENHDVTIIDESPDRIRRAEERMDVMALAGHGASLKTLRQAQAAEADLVIAVTSSDEVNVLAASTAKRLGAKRVVARITTSEYLESEDHVSGCAVVGVDLIISQQTLAASEIHRLVKSYGAISVEMFMDNRIEMIQLPVTAELPIIEKPLREIDLPAGALVAGILRKGEVIIPTGVDTLLEGDEAFLIAEIEVIARVERLFGKTGERRARKVMIVGGGEIGHSVARLLLDDGISVILLDHDQERCKELSKLLPGAVVIHGDGKNLTLLQEERVESCDVFVAVSGSDDTNLMATLLARHLGAKKTICLVSRSDYVPIYEALGISSSISPRLTAANRILKYVRHGEVVSVTQLRAGQAEILEIVASEKSSIAGDTLRDAAIPHGALIGAILGEKGALVPRGGDEVIHPGDTVLIFTTLKARSGVERLFRRRLLSL